MRVNIYSQELLLGDGDDSSDEPATELITQLSNTGVTYSAVRLLLHSSPRLHHPPQDDDRSAVTLWLPKTPERRERLAQQLNELASLVRLAPAETGLD
ncbi:hypothetical protein H7J86_24245 [Mycobacterium hackensackense]|uniref:hypothetical protein n=1 Tax=Mycobacterium hackensackense TaxID=228909 RepID=UPI002265B711|nr:hypothetical protein [Mycobacterium hackensackense]MCV7255278.1 hypothetical protein [Mycobacterium hackensackense]